MSTRCATPPTVMVAYAHASPVRPTCGRPVVFRTPSWFTPGPRSASASARGTSCEPPDGVQVQCGPPGSGPTRATPVPLMVRSKASSPLQEVASQVYERELTPVLSRTCSTPLSGLPSGLVRVMLASRADAPATMRSIDTLGEHASATPSPFVSSCPGFHTPGQLSHASPTPSASLSSCPGFATSGQLSAGSHTPSPSESGLPGQASHASPTPSPSLSACPGLGTVGQLSQASPTPSPSLSSWPGFDTQGQLSAGSQMPSPS